MVAVSARDGWPALGWEDRPWSPGSQAGASHRARLGTRGSYRSAVPPYIAELAPVLLDQATQVASEDTLAELTRFDAELGALTAPFAAVLIRSESASSSEIENLTATPKSIALAEIGGRAGPNAQLIVANTRAMESAIALSGDLDPAAIVAMQRALLEDTRPDFVGRWRDQPVWIGSGAISPHTASFVPPHHERVDELMDDLMIFCRRTDWPVLPQLAVAHAQFETIHPFPDGNGRTGRALIHAMLHRLGVTSHVTAPVSAGLLGDTRSYIAALTDYRQGQLVPIIQAFARACHDAVTYGRLLAGDLQSFDRWAHKVTTARRDSAGWGLIELVLKQPVISASAAAAELSVTVQNAQLGIDRLIADGILEQIGASRRNRFYQAPQVLAALDAFAERARRHR